MTEYQNLPNDPAMLLSFVNTQLRDNYASFSELVAAFYADADAITEKLKMIDYEYDETKISLYNIYSGTSSFRYFLTRFQFG